MLLPFGGHKGYGIALMTAALGGALAASASPGTSQGMYAIAIAPDVFGDASGTRAGVQQLIAHMRSASPRRGFERVDVSGDYERRHRSDSNGIIIISPATWQQIVRTSDKVGVDMSQFPKPIS